MRETAPGTNHVGDYVEEAAFNVMYLTCETALKEGEGTEHKTKATIVQPIKEVGDMNECSNYGIISLLSYTGKVNAEIPN